MEYYEAYRIVDGKAKWIIIDENFNENFNPAKENWQENWQENWLKGGV